MDSNCGGRIGLSETLPSLRQVTYEWSCSINESGICKGARKATPPNLQSVHEARSCSDLKVIGSSCFGIRDLYPLKVPEMFQSKGGGHSILRSITRGGSSFTFSRRYCRQVTGPCSGRSPAKGRLFLRLLI